VPGRERIGDERSIERLQPGLSVLDLESQPLRGGHAAYAVEIPASALTSSRRKPGVRRRRRSGGM
jgi:hypothetical protein